MGGCVFVAFLGLRSYFTALRPLGTLDARQGKRPQSPLALSWLPWKGSSVTRREKQMWINGFLLEPGSALPRHSIMEFELHSSR